MERDVAGGRGEIAGIVAAAVALTGLAACQAAQRVILIVDHRARGRRHLRQRTVSVFVGVRRVVIDIAFGIGLAAERPRLPREAVIAVVNVLRALQRAAVGVQLRAADQAAEGVVLEAVARKFARRIAVAQPCKRTLRVVSIGNVTTAIIRLPDQSVKPVIGVADGIAVGVGRGFQVAAARGVVTCAGQSASGKNPAYTSRSSQGFPE